MESRAHFNSPPFENVKQDGNIFLFFREKKTRNAHFLLAAGELALSMIYLFVTNIVSCNLFDDINLFN